MTACPQCGFSASRVTARWSMTLPVSVPSQNEASSTGQRWDARRKRYRAFSAALHVLLQAEARRLGIPQATARRLVTFTRLYGKGKRAYDYGNCVGGLKSALDQLVKLGLLVDDSPKWVDDCYLQESAERDGLRIEIGELL